MALNIKHPLFHLALIVFIVFCLCEPAMAQKAKGCTNGDLFKITESDFSSVVDSIFTSDTDTVGEIVYNIVEMIKNTLDGAGEKIFTAIVGSDMYKGASYAAMVLMVIFFGVGFMFGLVEFSTSEAIFRVIKLAIVAILISGDGWTLFNDTVVPLFDKAAEDIMNEMSRLGCEAADGDCTETGSDTAIGQIASTMDVILSLKMLVVIGSLFFTGKMGIVAGVVLAAATVMYVAATVTAIWIYLVAYAFKWLLLGFAPIFIVFLLFAKTRNLFTGWISQLVSFALQPIFVFSFLAFFLVLIHFYVDGIMGEDGNRLNLCQGNTDMLENMPFQIEMYRFLDENGNQYTGEWNERLPIDLLQALMFLILSMLAYTFVPFSAELARSIAGGGAMVSEMGGLGGQLISQATSFAKGFALNKVPGLGGK